MSLLPIFQWLAGTRLSEAMAASKWAFATVEMVHLLSLALLGGTVLMVDLRLLGLRLRRRPADEVARELSPFSAVSLVVLVISGVFLVIDHVAQAGSGLRDTETLHRIDPIRMKNEIEEAGFVLEAQSDALRNADDDHKLAIFDPSIRGRTDQVLFRFRKPQ